MAKLSYPETEESHTKTQEDVKIGNMYASYLPHSRTILAAIQLLCEF